jgi:hypothetical protein
MFQIWPQILRRRHVYKSYYIQDAVYHPRRNVGDLSQHDILLTIYLFSSSNLKLKTDFSWSAGNNFALAENFYLKNYVLL